MIANDVTRCWESLAGQRLAFVENFYTRLFRRSPRYRAMFPPSMEAQMERMVELWSSVARYSDRIDIVRPYLLQVGVSHRAMHIEPDDLQNFVEAFIEALADTLGPGWNEATERAWRSAFEDVVVPILEEGLEVAESRRASRVSGAGAAPSGPG